MYVSLCMFFIKRSKIIVIGEKELACVQTVYYCCTSVAVGILSKYYFDLNRFNSIINKR